MKKTLKYIFLLFVFAGIYACATGIQFEEAAGPRVVITSPTSDETNVSASTTIIAEFSENIDSETVTADSFWLEADAGISGVITVTDNVATFQPSASLDYATTYTVTLGGGISNTGGLPMGRDYSWSFQTAEGKATNWIKSYGWLFSDYFQFGIATSDGGYLAVGSIELEVDFALAVKLDSAGDVVWKNVFGVNKNPGDEQKFFNVTEADDGYIFVGYTTAFGAGSRDGWIVKVDFDGEIQWQKAFGGANSEGFNTIAKTSDGNFVASGYIMSGLPVESPWVVKINSRGSIVSGFQYAYENASRGTVNGSYPTSDGGLILGGLTEAGGTGDENALVMKLSSTGAVTFARAYDAGGNEEMYSIRPITGGYIFTATSDDLGFTEGGGWLVKTNADLTIDSQKAFGNNDGRFYLLGLLPITGGNYAVSGTYQQAVNSWYGVLMELNSSLTSDWQKSYAAEFSSRSLLGALVLSDSDGYVLFGNSEEFSYLGESDGWIASVDSSGECGECSLIADANFTIKNATGTQTAVVLTRTSTSATITNTTVEPFAAVIGIKTQCSNP